MTYSYKKYSLLFIGLILASAANADPIDASFQVTAQIEQECELTSAPGSMAFGDYIATTTKSALSSFQLTCTSNTAYTMELSYGNNATGTTRRMTNGTDYLTYGIYQDATYTTLWGLSADGQEKTATGSGSAQTYTAYGQIPAGQFTPGAGNYSDTVHLLVSY